MTSALETHESDQLALSEAQQKLAQQERITLEKVAAAHKAASNLNLARIPEVVGTMVRLNLVTPTEGEKIASKLRQEPNAVFDLLIKVADSVVTPSEGQEFSDSSMRSDEPDGWFKNKR